MVLLRLSPMALSQSRFALSPSAETLGSMSVLMKPCSDPWLTPWYTRHHDAFHAALDADPFARGLVELICSTKYLPGYVSRPPSGGMRTTLADELKAVAAARDDAIRADLDAAVARSWKRHDLEWLTGHGWGPRTAELFRQVWTAHVAGLAAPPGPAGAGRHLPGGAARRVRLAQSPSAHEPAQCLGRRRRDPLQ